MFESNDIKNLPQRMNDLENKVNSATQRMSAELSAARSDLTAAKQQYQESLHNNNNAIAEVKAEAQKNRDYIDSRIASAAEEVRHKVGSALEVVLPKGPVEIDERSVSTLLKETDDVGYNAFKNATLLAAFDLGKDGKMEYGGVDVNDLVYYQARKYTDGLNIQFKYIISKSTSTPGEVRIALAHNREPMASTTAWGGTKKLSTSQRNDGARIEFSLEGANDGWGERIKKDINTVLQALAAGAFIGHANTTEYDASWLAGATFDTYLKDSREPFVMKMLTEAVVANPKIVRYLPNTIEAYRKVNEAQQ